MKVYLLVILSVILSLSYALPPSSTSSSSTSNEDEELIKLPDYAITCKINDVDRDECIKKAIQDMIPNLVNGLESLRIPPIDPYVLNDTYYEFKRGIIAANLNIKTSKTYGLSNAEIKNVKTEISDDGMETMIETHFPEIVIEGLYKSEGRINNIKLNSKGYFNLTFTDVTAKHTMVGVFKYKNGIKFLQLEKFDFVLPHIGDFKVYASGLFPNPEFNQVILQFINQFWAYFYQELLPETKEIWEPIFIGLMNEFLFKVPFHDMLTLE